MKMRWRIYKIIQHDQTLLVKYPKPHNHCPFAFIFMDIILYSLDFREKLWLPPVNKNAINRVTCANFMSQNIP